MIDFLCQIEILLLNMKKLLKTPFFFQNFSIQCFFSLNCQNPGFVASLIHLNVQDLSNSNQGEISLS